MKLKLITAPALQPVTLAEAKTQLRMTHDVEDSYITGLIDIAASYIDGIYGLGFCLMPQTWELAIDHFQQVIKIPIYPLIDVSSVKYIDSEGTEQTVNPDVYQINNHGNMPTVSVAYGRNWPTARDEINAVKIQFQAGFDSLPKDLKHAVLILVTHWYENREAVSRENMNEVPFAAKAILTKYAVPGIS